MAPCTDSIMGSLPRAKAGVGSAVNDTTRQIGGAVGVAVFGSILSSTFTTHFTEHLPAGVPAEFTNQAKDSVGSALGAVTKLPADLQQFTPGIVDAAKTSFVDGFHVASLIAAVLMLIASLGVLRFLPSPANERGSTTRHAVAPRERRERRGHRGRVDARAGQHVRGGRASTIAVPDADAASTTRRAGRPRSEQAENAILDAALDTLVEDGYAGMSIERIVAKAGVGKATIYRRWSGKAEILVEALRQHACFDVPLPDTGDLRADLLTILRAIQRNMVGDAGPMMAAFAAEKIRHPRCVTSSSAFSSPSAGCTSAVSFALRSSGASCRPTPMSMCWPTAGPALLWHALTLRGRPAGEDLPARIVDELLRTAVDPPCSSRRRSCTALSGSAK